MTSRRKPDQIFPPIPVVPNFYTQRSIALFQRQWKMALSSDINITTPMKLSTSLIRLATALTLSLSLSTAATPEQEATFVASHKKALEANDAKALAKFLLTDGAEAETIEFFKMMMELEPGSKIESIELVKPTAEEAAKFAKPMTMPDGKNYKMPVTPYKQLVIKIATKSADGSSSSTSKSPVAEKNGKLVIPVPVPVK